MCHRSLARLTLSNFHSAADATSHLFFAYLRSISPDLPRGLNGISTLPIALQNLVQATEYPPETPTLLQVSTTKVVMIVDTVSPTPFALLRRAKNFEYRDSDQHLQQFSSFDDPIRALTDECHRVLRCISSANQSIVSSSKTSTSLRDASWSRFEDIGFGGAIEFDQEDDAGPAKGEFANGLKTAPQSSSGDLGRPTTPSWADFLSSGFADENSVKAPTAPSLLPPDKKLPPIPTDRGQSSQSHKRHLDTDSPLEPGELASINALDLDDSFWWVWVSSLAGEEPVTRKAVFGRCTLVETIIRDAKWLILEEQVKGAAPEPEPGAYIVEKKGLFGFSRKGKLSRRKSSAKKMEPKEQPYKQKDNPAPQSKTSIAPDQHARIQAAAAALQKRHREQEHEFANGSAADGRHDARSMKTNSALTLQPAIMSEASQAMKWANNYDKDTYRSAYLKDNRAGTGAPAEMIKMPSNDKPKSTLSPTPSTTSRQAPPPAQADIVPNPPAPATPKQNTETAVEDIKSSKNPSPAPEQPPSEPQQYPVAPAEDQTKKLKKKPGNTGIKGMFGSKKKTEQPPMKPTGAGQSAVAAARAALEGKAKASQEQPQMTNGSSLKKKPMSPAPATDAPEAELESRATPTADSEKSSVPMTGSEMPAAPAADIEKPATPKVPEEAISEPASNVQDAPNSLDRDAGPPRTQQAAEADALSRVDTNERDAANREFSQFDQGPLVEQPAFVPEDSPVSPEAESVPEKPELPEEQVTPEKQATPDEEKSMEATSNGRIPSPPPAADNASQDRWAQIRKNAAERAAVSETSGHKSTDTERTGDSETSGEESK